MVSGQGVCVGGGTPFTYPHSQVSTTLGMEPTALYTPGKGDTVESHSRALPGANDGDCAWSLGICCDREDGPHSGVCGHMVGYRPCDQEETQATWSPE